MKPIKIVMSAFGPYADKTVLNLAELGGRGLFLITGDTGSGKTTIFDALAFALFGEASGSNRSVDTLRSHFAKPDTKTYVELIFLHRGRTYEIMRNPSYERPKKRGANGVTTEPADATLRLPSGDVITGNRDVTAKIVDVLGINYRQFKQITMIAQGEFLQLLLADSKERGDIFRRVFETDLYQNIQRILKEREHDAKRRCDSVEQGIKQYISGISFPDDEKEQNLLEANIHNADDFLKELLASNKADKALQISLEQRTKKLDKKLAAQISSIIQAEYINQAFDELQKVQGKQKVLTEQQENHDKQKRVLQDAEKALYSVFTLEKAYLREQDEEQKLSQSISSLDIEIQKQTTDLEALQAKYQAEREKEPEREELASAIDRLTKMLTKYDEAKEHENELKELSLKKLKARAVLEEIEEQRAKLIEQKKTLNAEIEELSDIEVKLSICKQEGKELLLAHSGILDLKASLSKLSTLKGDSVRLNQAFIEAEGEFQEVNKIYTQKETAFLREQAGILAANLKDGNPCPVCGSTEHPDKAALAVDAPSEAELNGLKKETDLARKNMQENSERSASKLAEIKLAREQLIHAAETYFPNKDGNMAEEKFYELIEAALTMSREKKDERDRQYIKLEERVKRKNEAKKELTSLEGLLQTYEEANKKNEQLKNKVISEIASKTGELKALKSTLEYADRKTAEASIREWNKKLNSLKKAFRETEDAYHTLKNALEGNQSLLMNHKERLRSVFQNKNLALKAYIEKLTECGFPNEVVYHSALKTEDEIKELKQFINQYEKEIQAVERDLKRLYKETENKQLQDMEQLKVEKKDIEQKKKQRDDEIQKLMVRLGNNEPIARALEKSIADSELYQQEYLLFSKLSKTANGELSGKQKLAFEQYVQASYFTQILIEANKRMRIMTNSRFELLRQETAADLRSQTGLEIEVLDHYTGRRRPVKSLSGGESFKASLSLALALSDVIQSYAGGVEVDTLFIDEGFGALDSESLEQAIQTLVGLASGDRLVGIVSHVSELKERIDHQVVIKKSSSGSSIELIS